MSKLQLTGKMLRNLGYPEGPVIRIAIETIGKNYKNYSNEKAADLLKDILDRSHYYLSDPLLGKIAEKLIPLPADETLVILSETGKPFEIFGAEYIEEGAVAQMQQAARLPIAVAGALMPDAHHGYGLPIGGVLAVSNAVIPYGVGVDIGCRMCLSIFDLPAETLNDRKTYSRIIEGCTVFGAGGESKKKIDHPILEDPAFSTTAVLRNLQHKAYLQLGTSGSGNHFVEFGALEITEKDEHLNVEPGNYLALVSHSGSRALGANIADYYTKLAKAKRRLPPEAVNLSWFSLDEEEGMEYWIAMNLAGDYASACHHVIHERIAAMVNAETLAMVENHHNFAWKEKHEGQDVVVHRKGATPAGKNVLGIIPGSMTAPGFIVKGKGYEASLNSASHGAGRKLSRTAAQNNITMSSLNAELERTQVKLIGGGLDEAPFAYKDIEAVMSSQHMLVDTIGRFLPKIVRMDSAPPKAWRKKLKALSGN
jgi:tRNA-splicing ligase RtcB